MIPQFEEIRIQALKELSSGVVMRAKELRIPLAKHFGLTEEEMTSGAKPEVYSEYAHVNETCFTPAEVFISDSMMLLKNNQMHHYARTFDKATMEAPRYRVPFDKPFNLREKIATCLLNQQGHEQLDLAAYAKKSFGMFGGKEQSVKLLVENSLAGVIVDRFGKDVMMIPADADHFTVSVDVQVSSQFISWVFALGSQAKIVSPKNVVNQVRKEIEKLAEQYALPIENRREN